MQPFPTLGKLLIAAGVILALMGLALIFMDKIPWFGRLPGIFPMKVSGSTFTSPSRPA